GMMSCGGRGRGGNCGHGQVNGRVIWEGGAHIQHVPVMGNNPIQQEPIMGEVHTRPDPVVYDAPVQKELVQE
ncbi:hypothetical protein U1Q18_027888, partial [Sarracenia purpurea var. burkii]